MGFNLTKPPTTIMSPLITSPSEIVACGICLGVEKHKTVTLTRETKFRPVVTKALTCTKMRLRLSKTIHLQISVESLCPIRTRVAGMALRSIKVMTFIIRNNTFLRNNQGIACVTDKTNPTIENNNVYGTGVNENDENIQNCPR